MDGMKNPGELRPKMKRLFPKQQFNHFFTKMSDEELVEHGKLLRPGLPIATPVFDGAEEQEIMDSTDSVVAVYFGDLTASVEAIAES